MCARVFFDCFTPLNLFRRRSLPLFDLYLVSFLPQPTFHARNNQRPSSQAITAVSRLTRQYFGTEDFFPILVSARSYPGYGLGDIDRASETCSLTLTCGCWGHSDLWTGCDFHGDIFSETGIMISSALFASILAKTCCFPGFWFPIVGTHCRR